MTTFVHKLFYYFGYPNKYSLMNKIQMKTSNDSIDDSDKPCGTKNSTKTQNQNASDNNWSNDKSLPVTEESTKTQNQNK